VRALGADHVAESATQGGLGGGAVPDLGAVTPLAACPINSSCSYISTSKLFFRLASLIKARTSFQSFPLSTDCGTGNM